MPENRDKTGLILAKPFVAMPVMVLALTAADAPTGGEAGVHAFVLSNVYYAQGGEADSCPALDIGDLDRFFATLSPTDQAKYAGAENRQRLEARMNEVFKFRRLHIRGERSASVKFPANYDPKVEPTNELAAEIGALNGFPRGAGRLAFSKREVVYSSCSDPYAFRGLAKGFRTYDGKVAAGINLDGKVDRLDFVGSDGAQGIDNSLWRAVGCVSAFRENAKDDLARTTMVSMRAPTVVELTGVDSLRDDPEVAVTIVAVTEPLTRDGRGGPMARVTFTPDPNPRFRATVAGRIVGGVLTTDPVDLTLNYKEQIIDAPRRFRGARIHAKFGPDGSIEGSIFGYQTLDSYYASIEQMTQNGANLSRLSCPGVRMAIDHFADGYRDPRTGRFTAISSAYKFVGVRAFLRRPDQAAPGETLR